MVARNSFQRNERMALSFAVFSTCGNNVIASKSARLYVQPAVGVMNLATSVTISGCLAMFSIVWHLNHSTEVLIFV